MCKLLLRLLQALSLYQLGVSGTPIHGLSICRMHSQGAQLHMSYVSASLLPIKGYFWHGFYIHMSFEGELMIGAFSSARHYCRPVDG